MLNELLCLKKMDEMLRKAGDALQAQVEELQNVERVGWGECKETARKKDIEADGDRERRVYRVYFILSP